MSGVPVTYDYIREQGKQRGLGARLMALAAEGDRSRIYLAPTGKHEAIARDVPATWRPDMPLPDNPRDFKTPNYGLPTFADLFTSRQLVALTTFSDLVDEATERVRRDAAAAGLPDDGRRLSDGGTGATACADAVALYLGLAVDKASDYGSSICTWHSSKELIRNNVRKTGHSNGLGLRGNECILQLCRKPLEWYQVGGQESRLPMSTHTRSRHAW